MSPLPGIGIRFRPPARGKPGRDNAGRKGEAKVAQALRGLGVPVLDGAHVHDGTKERELDLLALIGGHLWIIEVKSSLGHPPRRAADGAWLVDAETLGKARRQLRRQVEALAGALPDADVAGLIVFSGRVRVEPPCAEATTLDDLAAFVEEGRGACPSPSPSPATLEAWRWLARVRARDPA